MLAQVDLITSSANTHRRRRWHPTPVLLPGKPHGRRSLVGCSPWGREESDTTEQLHFHFSLSCIGEGNGNPLQCSCLENPRDGGACWAAVFGVAQRSDLAANTHGAPPTHQLRCCHLGLAMQMPKPLSLPVRHSGVKTDVEPINKILTESGCERRAWCYFFLVLYHLACGILVPRPGIEPAASAMEV